MTNSPESTAATLHFRAPPPSPISSGRRSVTNDDVFTDFLEHSLRIPDLILPETIFPKQKFIKNPPKIDFQSLRFQSDDISKILEDSMARFGCFQLVNHGISVELISAVFAGEAAGIFRVSPEKKMTVMRCQEKAYGFEEHWFGEEESDEVCEEFVWSSDEGLKMAMEAILPLEYSNFSKKMEMLTELVEKAGKKILEIFPENYQRRRKVAEEVGKKIGSVSCLYKHRRRDVEDESENCVKHEVMRMLIRGTDISHSLSFHFCNGCSEFHVYSKKGWVSFKPDEHAIVVTVGDQIQARSGGKYKQVMGKPIYRADREDEISMAIMYPTSSDGPQPTKDVTISLGHQALFALFFTLFYNFLIYLFHTV